MTSGNHSAADRQTAWFFRPIILFATAYIINLSLHELAHALTAYALDVPFAVFHFAVRLAGDRGTPMEQVAIAVAGPLCALIIGLVCWFFYRRAKRSRSELMLLYLATFGVGTFFGNLMSSAFVGDFSIVSGILRLPMAVRYAATVVGCVLVSSVHFMAGWELRRLSPAGSSRLHALFVMILVPVVAGTAIVVLSSLPMPVDLAFGRLGETSFWIFGATGILMSRHTPNGEGPTLRLGWADAAALLAALIVERIMAAGFTFQHG